MGADIHAYVEWSPRPGGWYFLGEVVIMRNYLFMGLVAGIREIERPVVPPRGLPRDVSFDVENAWDNQQGDAHTPTWLTLEEVCLVEAHYHASTKAGPQVASPPELAAIIGAMQGLQRAGYPSRLVCWFDN